MKAALPARPARIILTAEILYGVGGCSREPERQQTAAESASPATPPAAARPDYMTEHVAKDAALSDALIGTWSEVITDDDGTQLDAVLRYAADRTLTVVVAARNKPDNRYSSKGTWSVAQGFLTRRVTPEGNDKTVTASDEILRIDKGQFVYVDGEDKKTKIATRVAPEKLAAAPAVPPPPQPQAVAATAPAADTPFFDDTLFVANEDVQTHIVHVTATTQFRLSVEIEEKVPINIVAQRGEVSPETYLMGLGALMVGQVMTMFDSSGEKTSTTNDLFKNRLSKRAAYGRFDSPWVTLKEGTYTVIFDNSGQLSPSRGDAPLHLRLYSRPVP